MSLIKSAVLALLTTAAAATSFAHSHRHSHLHKQAVRDDTFELIVENNCSASREFALYQINAAFDMTQMSEPVTIASGKSATIAAPYTAIGMRLSGRAEMGTAWQWSAQALFEFGYSAWGEVQGTAYDISLMETTDDVGIKVVPGNSGCDTKCCLSPSDCPADQGWTNADQVDIGSPADTVCYEGLTSFTVTWCPSED